MKKIHDKESGFDIKLDWWDKASLEDMIKFLLEDSFDTYNHMIGKTWDSLTEAEQKKLKSEKVFRSNTQVAIWTLTQLRSSAWTRIKTRKSLIDTNKFIECFNSNEKWEELINKNRNRFKF